MKKDIQRVVLMYHQDAITIPKRERDIIQNRGDFLFLLNFNRFNSFIDTFLWHSFFDFSGFGEEEENTDYQKQFFTPTRVCEDMSINPVIFFFHAAILPHLYFIPIMSHISRKSYHNALYKPYPCDRLSP